MTSSVTENIRHLPLHQKHVSLGARFGAFGEWEVPLYYTTILEEHDAVRRRAGLFDISHMGEFLLTGEEVESFLNGLLPRDILKLVDGQAAYSQILTDAGGMVDDIIVYKAHAKRFLIIVNAGNLEKDYAWFESHLQPGIELVNLSPRNGLLALQGPASVAILEKIFGKQFSALKYYSFQEFEGGVVARTGYTGEDGFEIMTGRQQLSGLWDSLMEAGKDLGLVAVGFGCRDTLRLEAAMPLYGHDMDETLTPLEAGLGWSVSLEKPSFPGRDVLLQQKSVGVTKKLVGFEMIDRGIPRQGYGIVKHGQTIGHVTSGTFAPTLKKNIGFGYVTAAQAAVGNEIEILVREKPLRANVVKLPFYKRQKS